MKGFWAFAKHLTLTAAIVFIATFATAALMFEKFIAVLAAVALLNEKQE